MTARPRRSVAAVAIAWLFILIAPGLTVAHAELATVTPKDKSTVPPPTEIVMTFTENLDPAGSRIVVVNSFGTVMAQGGEIDPSNLKQMTLGVSNITAGPYTIRWTSKSAQDGDIARGTTTFTATAATAPPSSPSAAASASAAPSASVAASPPPSAAASDLASAAPSPSGGSGTTTSASDALVPVVVGIVVLGGLAWWLLRSRSRSAS